MKQPLPYTFGISDQWHSLFDLNAGHIKRLRKLAGLEDSELIFKVCKHYISNFIPNPVAFENQYWIISCFPSTDRSPVRISIWFPEVFNIAEAGNYFGFGKSLQCMVFVHSDFLERKKKAELELKIDGLRFVPGYRFRTGIPEQLAAFMPLTSYFAFVGEDILYESIRAHNFELMQKGRTPFKRGHNHEFVRYLFGDESLLEEDV